MPERPLPDRCPACGSPTQPFMHECSCSDLEYLHIVCDACDTAFKPEILAELAHKESGAWWGHGHTDLTDVPKKEGKHGRRNPAGR